MLQIILKRCDCRNSKRCQTKVGRCTAIIGVSGGVDSTTLATMLASALGGSWLFIDTGGMRKVRLKSAKRLQGGWNGSSNY